MNFTVASSDLSPALRTLANTAASGGDILSHYAFRHLPDGSIEALSSNGRAYTRVPVKTESVEGTPGSAPTPLFTVEAKRLHCLLDAIGGKTVVTFHLRSGGEVEVETDRGTNLFSSLDPALFPYWDETLSAAKVTAKVLAGRLHGAYSHARNFIYDEEAKAPYLCVAEFRGGCLLTTDQMAVSIVKVEGMDGSELRVHGKDLNNLLHFLSADPASEIEIREGDRASFFLRSDGVVFGATRPVAVFPKITVSWDVKDDYSYEVFREELAGNIAFLSAGARWDDSTVRLKPSADGKSLSMSMQSVGGKPIFQRLPVQAYVAAEAPLALPEDGFPISHPYLTRTLAHHSSTSAKLGVTRKNAGGWVRVTDVRDGDTYLTTIAWIKKSV